MCFFSGSGRSNYRPEKDRLRLRLSRLVCLIVVVYLGLPIYRRRTEDGEERGQILIPFPD